MNIADILERQAVRNGAKPFVFLDDRIWTFGELNMKVWNGALFLHSEGVRTGDVIVQTFTNQSLQLVAMLAAARVGATVLTIPQNTPHERHKDLLCKVDARFLATDIPDVCCDGLKVLQIEEPDGAGSVSSRGMMIREENPDAPWIIAFGSGSTGCPKLLPVTHDQQWERNKASMVWLPYTEEDVFTSLIHLDFLTTKQRYLEALTKGASIVFSGGDLLNNHDNRKNRRISVVYGTVFHAEHIMQTLPADTKGYFESLTAFLLNCSTVSGSLRRRVRERLCSKLYVLYGTNESSTMCVTELKDVYAVQGTVGRPNKGFELQVVGPGEKPLPHGEPGTIRVKSRTSIDGYFQDEESTRQFFRNGWFYPGDHGVITNDGQLIHLGRADDLMIMNGINIYPSEIEQVLCSHPEVHDVAAMPLTHEVHQDIPVCAVVLEKNANETAEDLLDFAREKLGASAPFRIVILDAIPCNEQGKPMRAELHKMIVDRLGQNTEPADNNDGSIRVVSTHLDVRQLQGRFVCSFIMPDEPKIVVLDRWIDNVLCNDLKTDDDCFFPDDRYVPVQVRQWLWRCLQLSRLLLQAGRAPIFDPPLIRACSRKSVDSRKWTAVAEFALIDDFPKGMYEVALQASFSLAAWAMAHEPVGKNLDFFFKRIQERIVEPLYKVLPVGKSTYPVLKAVHEMGIPFRHLGGGVFQLGWGANARRMDRSTTEKDSAMGAKLSHNKVLATRLLWSAGLPAAVHSVVRKYENALGAARQIGWPVVIKPADRDRGEGVTIGVSDEQALKNAFEHALEASQRKEIIVERMVPGVCHRFFVSNGKLLYAVKRLPMSVVGDGKRSVEKLVADEYELQQQKPPWKRTEIRSLDQLAFETIAAAGMTVSSVPQKGAFVPLRPIESTLWGGIDEEVTDRIHPENLRVALEAASVFGLHVAGIDIISNDITKPWYENGAIVNEVNYSPLFGGGEISRRHIPYFIREFMQSDGTVPVTVFAGGDQAWDAAVQRWKTLVLSGRHAVLTDERRTIGPSGRPIAMPFVSLYRRIRALTLSSKVEVIIPVVRTDEFLDTGLPLEFVDAVSVIDEPLISFSKKDMLVTSDRYTEMKQLLTGWGKG